MIGLRVTFIICCESKVCDWLILFCQHKINQIHLIWKHIYV